jgi:Arc/MetJ-type ribon-helix-helix transcriptional regulator
MQVALPKHLEDYLVNEVAEGRATSADELIAEALEARLTAEAKAAFWGRVEASRQQAADGKLIAATDDYFERKRERIRKKFMIQP